MLTALKFLNDFLFRDSFYEKFLNFSIKSDLIWEMAIMTLQDYNRSMEEKTFDLAKDWRN